MGEETHLVKAINHITKIVAALDTIFEFTKNLTKLVFNGVGISANSLNFSDRGIACGLQL